jgi:hypothetical protein
MYTIHNVAAQPVVLTQPEFDMLLDLAHPVRNGETKPVFVAGDSSNVKIDVASETSDIRYREQTLEADVASKLVFSAVQVAYGRA